jgi:hypothetical protein
MLAFAAGLVEGEFLHEEVLGPLLDAAAERSCGEQPARRQRRWELRRQRCVQVYW